MLIRRNEDRDWVTESLIGLFIRSLLSPHVSTTRVTKRIEATPERVYQAIIDPYAVQQWMVPDDMTSHVHSFEPEEGGTFRISLTYDDPSEEGKTEASTDTFEGRFVRLLPGREVV